MKNTLVKKVYDKDEFEKVVDTGFKELSNVKDPTFFDLNLATINDFFILYDKFFYEIPKEGDLNSHAYLVERSGNYVDNEKINATIEALTKEINSLREENLNLLTGNIETQSNKVLGSIKEINLGR